MKSRARLPSWQRLDNAANIFPLISHKNFSNVFRLAAELKTPVEPELLQKALDMTLPFFGNFNYRMRSGIFWYYFEPTNAKISVMKESQRPCSFVDTKLKHHHLFRILYFNNRISLEVFHAITDGTGATNFLKALLSNYLKLINGAAYLENLPRIKVKSELEDSYIKYYQKMPKEKVRFPHAYKFKGKRLAINSLGVIHGYMDINLLLKHSKSLDVTLTEYITSVFLWSIYISSYYNDKKKKPIHLAVPVNLRRFFESGTNMNFFAYITIAINKSNIKLTFEEFLLIVKTQFRSQITKENMLKNISMEVSLRLNPFVRAFPLFLKNIIVRMVHIASIQSYTSTLSNIGKIEMPDEWKDDISHFELLMNATSLDPLKCAICTYQDKFVVTLTSQLESTNIQKNFFRKLAEDGLDVIVESNGEYYELL